MRALHLTFRVSILAAFAAGVLVAGCGSSNQKPGNDAAGADTGTGLDPDAGMPVDDGGTPDGGGAVAIALNESTYTFATPDLHHGLTATVTGSATTTVTWSTSNSYIATVSPAGVLTSVSGGAATITATSTADPTKSASCTVTVAEPDRPKAAT